MGYFKKDKNSWLRYGNLIYYVTFLDICPWCGFQIEYGFFVFFKNSAFLWRGCKPTFLRGQLFNHFQNFQFQFQSLRFWIKNDLLKVPKIDKSAKITPSQTRGHMGYFKNEQKSWLRCGKPIFCVTFENMYTWYRLQIEGVVFAFFNFGIFCEEFRNSLFEGSNY